MQILYSWNENTLDKGKQFESGEMSIRFGGDRLLTGLVDMERKDFSFLATVS